MSAGPSLDRAFWKAMADAVLHIKSLVFVAVFSVSVALKSSYGFLVYDPKDLVILVLPIAGTIVALALPAAQLSMELVTQAEKEASKFLLDESDLEKKAEYVKEVLKELRASLSPAWRAVVYALLSLLFSVLGSLGFFFGTMIFDLVVLIALGFLIVSAIWFYPTVKYAFNLEAIDTMLDIAASLNSKGGKELPPNQAAPADQKAPLPGR